MPAAHPAAGAPAADSDPATVSAHDHAAHADLDGVPTADVELTGPHTHVRTVQLRARAERDVGASSPAGTT